MSDSSTTAAAPRDLRQWLNQIALPSFARIAVHPGEEGYVEFLAPDFTVDPRPRKSTLSTGRLIYCFSHAAVLDPKGPGLAAARHGVDYLLTRCANPAGGFYRSLNADGSPLDAKADLGDLGFVLFGLGWYHRASGDKRALEVAETTMRFIEKHLASPAGGFLEDTVSTLPRRQNPHMHLLEACHVLAEESGETAAKPGAWLKRAKTLIELLKAKFIDPANGSLIEQFDADWVAKPGAIREPGSHFEWVWALLHHRRLTGDDSVLPIAEGFYRFAVAHGIDSDKNQPPLAFDAIDGTGKPVTTTKLMWPQTEAVKAFAARVEFLGDKDAKTRLDAMVAALFQYYVDAKTGLFTNQVERDGSKRIVEMPVRVLYHLELALAEAARLHG
ncbi:AGE family epimerase/isomerase [Telmatospirillum sp.]|uniref:AGE family epimerase/isomerase n=1 Tax=Telmatospirillum sp. TaxID=2079197 RepID=UPI00284F47E5|nr:AGE family epimerase/isomerase [Telmatospirillum sp.]MDR3439670.1 AGE family epimerase/isomerase [Telmatospirillum sp.]